MALCLNFLLQPRKVKALINRSKYDSYRRSRSTANLRAEWCLVTYISAHQRDSPAATTPVPIATIAAGCNANPIVIALGLTASYQLI
jgi:hypothetical protein